MLLGLNRVALNSNSEEAMYKELYENWKNLIEGTQINEFVDSKLTKSACQWPFYGEHGVNVLRLPNLAEISYRVLQFHGIQGLKEIYLPKLTTCTYQIFQYCTSLEKIYMPIITNLPMNWQFTFCYNLKEIHLESLTTVSNWVANSFSTHQGSNHTTDLHIYVTSLSSSQILSTQVFTNLPGTGDYYTEDSTTFHCSDGIITYDGSAWVVTANS